MIAQAMPTKKATSWSHCCSCLIGEAEALSLGEDKKPILDLYTLTTEERVADDDTDIVIRWATSLGPASTMLPTASAGCNVQALSSQRGVLRFMTMDVFCMYQASESPEPPA